MRDKLGDKVRLQHIMDSIAEITSAMSGETKISFVKNHILRIAVVKWIEIIGEAANNISRETKNTTTNIEWAMIIGLRHIVVHEYFGINYEAIWDIATDEIPILKQKIEKLIKEIS